MEQSLLTIVPRRPSAACSIRHQFGALGFEVGRVRMNGESSNASNIIVPPHLSRVILARDRRNSSRLEGKKMLDLARFATLRCDDRNVLSRKFIDYVTRAVLLGRWRYSRIPRIKFGSRVTESFSLRLSRTIMTGTFGKRGATTPRTTDNSGIAWSTGTCYGRFIIVTYTYAHLYVCTLYAQLGKT